MSDFLEQLARRAVSPSAGIRPRLPSAFEAPAPSEPWTPVDLEVASASAPTPGTSRPQPTRRTSVATAHAATVVSAEELPSGTPRPATTTHPAVPVRASVEMDPVRQTTPEAAPELRPTNSAASLPPESHRTQVPPPASPPDQIATPTLASSGVDLPRSTEPTPRRPAAEPSFQAPPVLPANGTPLPLPPPATRIPAVDAPTRGILPEEMKSGAPESPRPVAMRPLDIHPQKSVGRQTSPSADEAKFSAPPKAAPASPTPPAVHVSIGRVEIRAAAPAAPAPRPPAPRAPRLTLDEFLRNPRGGRR